MTILFGSSAKPTKQHPQTRLRIQTSVAGIVRPIGYGQNRLAPNLLWYGDFTSKSQKSQGAAAGKGSIGGGEGKGSAGVKTYEYFAAVVCGLCEGPITSVLGVWNNKTEQTLASLGFEIFLGGYAQAAWGYLTTNHPSEALTYRGIAYVAAGPLALGDQPELPNLTFEVKFAIADAISGLPDGDPSLVVDDVFTNDFYGAGFPSAAIGDWSVWSAYCRATGIVISPIISDGRAASDFALDILRATNSEAFMSSGVLNVTPYGDQAITAHGATYTPPSAPEYDLDEPDFLAIQGGSLPTRAAATGGPVRAGRLDPSSQRNVFTVKFLDRTNDYNQDSVDARDDAAIAILGERAADPVQCDFICDRAAAVMSANLLLGREQIRNYYAFTVGRKFILLDCMDIVSLTSARLSLARQWVRIRDIIENGDGTLTMLAEEYLAGTGAAPLHGSEAKTGYIPNYNTPPPDTNPPLFFAAPYAISQSLELWVVASGPSGWGGCDVYASSDSGGTYRLLGRMTGPCRQGELTADLDAPTEDPDETNTLSVDLTESLGELLSGTEQDADEAHTLCYVDGEFLAYADAALTSSHKYDLTYLRRGLYGSPVGAHATGATFARLDSGVFGITYSKEQIGTLLYVKLTPFNIWGGGLVGLDDVDPIIIVVPPPQPLIAVQDFSVTQVGSVVVFSWTDIVEPSLKGYDISFGPIGGTVDQALILTEASRTTETTTAVVPPGDWTFYIRAHDVSDELGPPSSFDLTVTSNDPIVAELDEEPDWLGTISGFVVHHTGILIPDSTKNAGDMTDDQLWETFVAFPVVGPYYIGGIIDIGFDDAVRVWSIFSAVPGSGVTGTPVVTFQLEVWLDGDPEPGVFVPWSVGNATGRYFRGKLLMDTSVPSYIRTFGLVLDQPVVTEQVSNFAVGSSGSTLTFADYGVGPYHQPPLVQCTPSDGILTGAGASSPTTDDVFIQGFLGSSLHAGTVNVTITGN